MKVKMADEVEEIKRRIDIVDFISQYLELKKAGRNFKAPCPFHSEKEPSFIVSPEKQIWHCFGCQKGGDIFGFLMEYEGVDFTDALKQLADKAGVKLKPKDPKIKKLKDELFQINLMAARLYHFILTKQKPGQLPLKYLLEKRGLDKETIVDFKIGYAPDSWDTLSKFLQKRGFADQDILNSGLVIQKEDGSYYDRFRNRIMFPVLDISQNVIAFSGRFLEKEKFATAGRAIEPAKYINSPDTPIYSKSQILYPLDRAKDAIRQNDQVIIVEGQMDVVACHQAGFKNTIASSGTAVTLDQLKTLKRFTKHFAFAFDADSAGEQATRRAIETAYQAQIIPKIILIPAGKDPADCIRQDPIIFQKAVESAKDAVDFYFEKTRQNYPAKNLTSEQKQEIVSELIPIIKSISQPVLVGDYLKKMAKLLDTEERYLYEAFKKSHKAFSQSTSATDESQPEKTSQARDDLLEQRVLGLILAYPKDAKQVFAQVKSNDFKNPDNLAIVKAAQKSYTKDGKINQAKFESQLSDQERKLADIYSVAIQSELADMSEKTVAEEVAIAGQRLKSQRLEKVKKDFQQKIAQAEAEKDRAKIKKLLSELQRQIRG